MRAGLFFFFFQLLIINGMSRAIAMTLGQSKNATLGCPRSAWLGYFPIHLKHWVGSTRLSAFFKVNIKINDRHLVSALIQHIAISPALFKTILRGTWLAHWRNMWVFVLGLWIWAPYWVERLLRNKAF